MIIMLNYFFSGVLPRKTDLLFQLLFPANILTFPFNLAMIVITLIIYISSIALFKRYSHYDERTWKDIGKEIAIFTIIGFFVTFVLYIYAIILFGKSFLYLKDAAKNVDRDDSDSENNSHLSTVKKILIQFYRVLIVIAIIALLAGGAFIIYMGYLYGVYAIIGVLAGFVIMLVKNPRKLPYFNSINSIKRLSAKNKKILKIVFIITPLVFGTVFITTGLIKIHKPAPTGPTSNHITDIRLMTYNIRTGLLPEKNPVHTWDNRRSYFVNYVNSFNADIICVQEAYLFALNYIVTNLNELSGRHYEYTALGRNDGVQAGEHEAVIFDADKFKFLDGDTFWLSSLPSIPSKTWGNVDIRTCSWARLLDVKTGAQFCVFDTHFDFSDYFHIQAAKLVNQKVVEYSGGLPTFLAGDFNMQNTSQGFQYLEDYGTKPLSDAFRIYQNGTAPFDYSTTYNFTSNYNPSNAKRIDFIFMSSAIHVDDCWISHASYGGNENYTFSDHFPVIGDFHF